ncbi:MAG: MBG domain-containing protein, partial [Clostridia bacterium]
MKKIARNIIVAVLVLSLTLGIFSGCKKPIENKSLAEKYGITMSDKTVTYDGEKHALAVSVDNTILQGKSYEVTYEYGGAVLTKAEFTDAGEYGITAKIKVAGDETVYPLTNKIIIKKAPLELEVGNLFLRQGQGMATLGNPRDLFKEAAYIGKDTNAILGTLSFEIYNGNTKVNDVSTLKPSASVATPYKAKITGIKDLTNYEVKLGEGKLYVLIDSEYDNAKSLKEEIATVPTTTTIDTLDYYA